MKILHISKGDIKGGAFIAAYRIHCSLREKNIDSYMWVDTKISNDPTVMTTEHTFLNKKLAILKTVPTRILLKIMKKDNRVIHSPSFLSSSWVKKINESDADVINLHWVNREMLSIEDIGMIKKPLVWTLHDMWAFCGMEHYAKDNRWREGYQKHNKPKNEFGFDLNRWTWNRKKNIGKNQFKL